MSHQISFFLFLLAVYVILKRITGCFKGFNVDTRISVPQLEANIGNALKSWHTTRGDVSLFRGLKIFQHSLNEDASSPRKAINKILLDLLETLKKDDEEGYLVLTRHFLDGEKMRIIANSLNISLATAHRKQNKAIAQAATILHRWEIKARDRWQDMLEKRLDRPTYSQLVGFDDHLDKLSDLLTQSRSPWLISIEGYGGVGKTSLAHAVSLKILRQRLFDDLGWVSARSQIFELSGKTSKVDSPTLTFEDLVEKLLVQLLPEIPQPETLSNQEAQRLLQSRLKQRRHLIVIDNLETVQDLEELLPMLRNLASPSKFLLTSRKRLDYGTAIFHFPLPELSAANTLKLIRYEIEQHNLTHLGQASDDDLQKIYQTVGGNPLAIRLVVGQTHVFALHAILDDLNKARSKTVEELYQFIYWRAWNTLDEPTRKLFLTMPLITDEGERIEDFAELSELDMATVHTSLKQLVDLNLVNSLGDHNERHYSIHNLTRSFLQEQVLKWKQSQSLRH